MDYSHRPKNEKFLQTVLPEIISARSSYRHCAVRNEYKSIPESQFDFHGVDTGSFTPTKVVYQTPPASAVDDYPTGTLDGDFQLESITIPASGGLSASNAVIDQLRTVTLVIDEPPPEDNQSGTDKLSSMCDSLAESIVSTAEAFIAATLEGAVPGGNKIGSVATPKVPTKSDAYEYVADLAALLSYSSGVNTSGLVLSDDRFLVVPPWFLALMQKDVRFSAAQYVSPDGSALKPNQAGWACGMRVFVSRNVPNTAGAKYKIIAGHYGQLEFAEEIVNVIAFDPEDYGGDPGSFGIRAEHIYGAKCLDNTKLAMLIADIA